MNILVLGGSGFVSGHVLNEALAAGHNVWYVTRGNRDKVPGAQPIKADKMNSESLYNALKETGLKWDAVMDCICYNDEQARIDMSVLPEFTDRVIVISTDSVYHPDHKQVPQTEDGIYMVTDIYGGRKRRMELAFINECPDSLKWTAFRPQHMIGAHSELGCFPMHKRQKDLLAQLRAGASIQLVGDAAYLFQPLHAADLARAMIASVDNPKTFNEIFCIAGPDTISNRQYFETIAEIMGVSPEFESVSMEEYNKTNDDGYVYFCQRVYDLSKLRNAGLPVPSISFRDGIEEQINYLISQGR